LLGFAKHMDLRSDSIDLEHLVREVLGFLGKEAEYRNVAISIEAAEDLPTIEGDRGQLQQVFLNLINNALAAVDDGGMICITLRREGASSVAVVVADNGCGIPKENLRRIFEPFFTTKEGWGTGLGLSITYGIVEKLGGRIEVDSTVGQGTRFTVVLPRVRKA
jgi:signal transduction histidine kinase